MDRCNMGDGVKKNKKWWETKKTKIVEPEEEIEVKVATSDSKSEEPAKRLEEVTEELPEDKVILKTPTKKVKECKDCARSGALECNYCDENNEWPRGQACSMCDGTGYRK